MTRSSLVAFCLVILGVYGVLYAAHAGRSASNEIFDLTSQIDDVEAKLDELNTEVEDVKSVTNDLEFERGAGR